MKKYPGYAGINQEKMESVFTLTTDTGKTYSHTLTEAIVARENRIGLPAHIIWNGELTNDNY